MRASRLVSILLMLQSRGRVSARTLAAHLEVSTRTVYRDVDELCAAGVPVIVDRGAAGGFSLLEGWRTTLTGLTTAESQALFLAGLPGPAAELGLGDTVASAQLKLLAALPRDWQPQAQRMAARFHVDLAGWYRRTSPGALLRVVADAVWTDHVLEIEYTSWRGEVRRELEPLGLVVKGGEWYLVARPRDRKGARTYRVDQIRAATAGAPFARPAFELAAYWRASTERFEREIYRATATVRISARGRTQLAGQSTVVAEAIARAGGEEGGWWTVELPIESVEQATGQLLGLGTDVEVLAPAALRKSVRDLARSIAARHARPARR